MPRALWILLLLLAAGCGVSGPFYGEGYAPRRGSVVPDSAAVRYRVFLIGDAGDVRTSGPALRLLKEKLEGAGARSAVVFLGDNIYCCGLPEEGAPGRKAAEQDIDAQLRLLEGYDGQVVFLPGNHDWNDGRPGGWAAIRRQEQYIEAALGERDAFRPDGGCPGPEEVRLTGSLTLVVLGTAWWIYPHEKPTPANSDCPFAEERRFARAVDSLLARNAGKQVLVAGHHPVYSSGPHAGFFAPLDRLFGDRQDLAGRRYGALRDTLLRFFEQHDGLVHAAGHDHSLQYHRVGGQHYVVSGAGSRTSRVSRGAAFAYSHRGFAELIYYESGRVWLRVWVPGKSKHDPGKVVFQTDLTGGRLSSVPLP